MHCIAYFIEQIVIYFSGTYLASNLSPVISRVGTIGVTGVGVSSIGVAGVGGIDKGGVSLGLPLAQAVLDQGAGADSQGATVGVLLGVQSGGAKKGGNLMDSALGYKNIESIKEKHLDLP